MDHSEKVAKKPALASGNKAASAGPLLSKRVVPKLVECDSTTANGGGDCEIGGAVAKLADCKEPAAKEAEDSKG